MMEDTTFTDDLYQRLIAVMGQPAADQFIEQLTKDWGGERPFIAKRARRLRAAREKVREEVGTRPDAELIEEHGISRRTLYRWIGKEKEK